MSLLQISEIFGNDTSVPQTFERRTHKWCPFRTSPCTKQGIVSPLGICSLSDGRTATVSCPVRFLERGRLFIDAARLAFGTDQDCMAVPEVRLLEVPGERTKKIGKVDFLLVQVVNQTAADFAALEIQSVYISGRSIRPMFDEYLREGQLPAGSRRRPDFRSSAQKRLMPQLALKVPIFRRWGKRFFVAVDATLFKTLPKMREQSAGNAEVTWLVYPFARSPEGGYHMGDPEIHHTVWEDVLDALREGYPPEKSELLNQLTKEVPRRKLFRT